MLSSNKSVILMNTYELCTYSFSTSVIVYSYIFCIFFIPLMAFFFFLTIPYVTSLLKSISDFGLFFSIVNNKILNSAFQIYTQSSSYDKSFIYSDYLQRNLTEIFRIINFLNNTHCVMLFE